MPDFDIYTLPESEITISGGGQLSGVTQGDGSHLDNLFITLDSNNFQAVTITDNDDFFADNDGNQSLTNPITYDGTSHAAGRRVEAEYLLTLEDPDGNTYTVIGFNIVGTGGGRPFGSVEGLAFLDVLPPVGVPLEVIASQEGPGNSETPFDDYFTPPCFVTGTLIDTPEGPRGVETLAAGDLVTTLDRGPQALVWVGSKHIAPDALATKPAPCPLRLRQNGQTLTVSPQHRILMSGWQAELLCGEDILVAARHLVRAGRADVLTLDQIGPQGVTYWHLMFNRHEIVTSNGIHSESFCPGPEVMRHMPGAVREFRRFFPGFNPKVTPFDTVRRSAKAYEARALAAALGAAQH